MDMIIGWLITIVVGFIFFLAFWLWVRNSIEELKVKNQKAIDEAVANRLNFTESKVVAEEGNYYVATDETQKKVFCAVGVKPPLLIDYADIVSVEVKVDGDTLVLKKSLPLSALGAFVGGATIGGKNGSLIGALAFGNSSERRVEKIVLHVLLRNQPVQSICIESITSLTKKESYATYFLRYKEASERTQELYDMFSLIIDTADQDRNSGASTVQQLKDLAELHKQGSITDEEYEKLKGKVIGE